METVEDSELCLLVTMGMPAMDTVDGLDPASAAYAHEWGLYFEEIQAHVDGNVAMWEEYAKLGVGREKRDLESALAGVKALRKSAHTGTSLVNVTEPVKQADVQLLSDAVTGTQSALVKICPSWGE